MLTGEFHSDISVLNVLGFCAAKAKPKEGLTYPKISGIFVLVTTSFKPGEYFPRKRLITCLCLSSKLFQKIILEYLDGNFNNSLTWESVLIYSRFGNTLHQPGDYDKDNSQSLFSWEVYSSIDVTLHFEISLCPVKLIYVTV